MVPEHATRVVRHVHVPRDTSTLPRTPVHAPPSARKVKTCIGRTTVPSHCAVEAVPEARVVQPRDHQRRNNEDARREPDLDGKRQSVQCTASCTRGSTVRGCQRLQ